MGNGMEWGKINTLQLQRIIKPVVGLFLSFDFNDMNFTWKFSDASRSQKKKNERIKIMVGKFKDLNV